MAWVEKLYSSSWSKRFSGRALAQFGHLDDCETLAEDAASMAAMKLSGYAEQDASDAFIMTVFKNALTDCVRERHGFPRPRKWLEDLGELGRLAFKLVCLKGLSRAQLSAWVSEQSDKDGRVPGGAPNVAAAQALAQSIFDQMQDAQECSPWRRHMARENDSEEGTEVSPFANLDSEELKPEQQLALDQMRHFIETLVGAAGGDSDELDRQRMHVLAEQSWSQMGLDDSDRLVLSAYLGRGLGASIDGRSEPTEQQMAQDLGLSVPQIRNRRQKVLRAIRDIFGAENG